MDPMVFAALDGAGAMTGGTNGWALNVDIFPKIGAGEGLSDAGGETPSPDAGDSGGVKVNECVLPGVPNP